LVGATLLMSVALVVASVHTAVAGGKASFKILVPESPNSTNGDATLWIDGKKVPGAGTTREVKAPPLQKGRDAYTFKVLWEPNNYTKIWRTKVIKPGEGQVTVDLTKPNPTLKDHIEVRWVPTPDDIVAAMCKLGKVSKKDVVYDLGCGDGVMVVMAVEKFGAKRGVGVDIDPKRIEESKVKAKDHGVADKVEFRVGDVLKVKDLSDADVVLLYMGDDINKRLQPILKSTLKPGARVVSHRFLMGDDWKPTKTEKVTGKTGGEYLIHLWVIGKNEK
jgi:uncharacterized protein (TIGR03000 family)